MTGPWPLTATPVQPQDDLAWMEGRWCSEVDGERIEETWLAPRRQETVGISRTEREGRVVAFEFLRIARRGSSLRFIAQPGGAAPTEFPRIAGGPGWIRFENRRHDFPQRIEYRRRGDQLQADVAGPGKGGGEFVLRYRYRACGGPQRRG